MTTPQEKAQCVSWFIETKSDVQTLLLTDPQILTFCLFNFSETRKVASSLKQTHLWNASSSEIRCSMFTANSFRLGMSFG